MAPFPPILPRNAQLQLYPHALVCLSASRGAGRAAALYGEGGGAEGWGAALRTRRAHIGRHEGVHGGGKEPPTLDGGRWGSWEGQPPHGACRGRHSHHPQPCTPQSASARMTHLPWHCSGRGTGSLCPRQLHTADGREEHLLAEKCNQLSPSPDDLHVCL